MHTCELADAAYVLYLMGAQPLQRLLPEPLPCQSLSCLI
jgi:hypothetical protein